MNRKEMLEDCPEEFEEKLIEIIDHIEGKINDVLETFKITSLDDLGEIVKAHDELSELAGDLY